MRLTVGPLPPSVYWRRRAIVLGATLLVLFLVAQACMAATAAPGGDAGGPAAPPTSPPASETPPSPPATPSADRTPDRPDAADPPATQEPTSGDECTDDEMRITVRASVTTFGAGDPVTFTIDIRNDADRTCARDVGGAEREIYLIQGTGATKVWSTRQCGAPTGSEVASLPPGFQSSHHITWYGRASDTCDDTGAPAGALVSPGEYQLFARLGSAHSQAVPITVT